MNYILFAFKIDPLSYSVNLASYGSSPSQAYSREKLFDWTWYFEKTLLNDLFLFKEDEILLEEYNLKYTETV